MFTKRFPWGPLRFLILSVAGLFAIFYKFGFIGVMIAILLPATIWVLYFEVSKSRFSEFFHFLHPMVDWVSKLFWLLMFFVIIWGLFVLFVLIFENISGTSLG